MKYLKMTKLKASGFILNLIRKMQNGAFAENSIKVVQKMPTLNYLHLLFLEKWFFYTKQFLFKHWFRFICVSCKDLVSANLEGQFNFLKKVWIGISFCIFYHSFEYLWSKDHLFWGNHWQQPWLEIKNWNDWGRFPKSGGNFPDLLYLHQQQDGWWI